jgi:Flp pilus assembly protein TadG
MGGTDIRHIGRRLGCRLRQGAGRLIRDQRGNALMLTAAAIVPVIGIVGSAVDIGRAYMTQLRLQQACDAGVLAGRRAMAAGVYGDLAQAEADKMFAFNFPAGLYGSSHSNFASEASGSADVVGSATASLPTAIMYIFGNDQFDLSVNCTAKLEISNVDVMLVLDVTGSMRGSRIAALQTAAKDFFATLASADMGDGRLRVGVVPYSSTVNVGKILRDANPAWLSDKVTLPSRELNDSWQNCNWRGCTTTYEYKYKDREFTVGSLAPGSSLTFNTGTGGGNVTAAWDGCIIERQTKAFASNETAPDDAYDMDIDTVPTATDATKWKLFLPAFTYDRGKTASVTTTSNYTSLANAGGDTAACPVAAMNLKKVPKTGESGEGFISQDDFDDYIDDLQAKGFTYHDAGMAWGARLISPTGLFASENNYTNGKPISRHIIFMTDGDMKTPPSNLSHQGLEDSQPRIGAVASGKTSKEADAIARHNNRFVQLCRRARTKGITIWVVSFGVGSNTQLNNCASSGKAYEADNAEQLNSNFQAIARQLSKLRLAQ